MAMTMAKASPRRAQRTMLMKENIQMRVVSAVDPISIGPRSCNAEKHLIDLYQEWKKRQNPEVHFVQASIDAMTGLHLPEPSEPTEKLESTDMDVDQNAIGDRTAEKGDAYIGDDDFDLEDEDLLGTE